MVKRRFRLYLRLAGLGQAGILPTPPDGVELRGKHFGSELILGEQIRVHKPAPCGMLPPQRHENVIER
jgi:hypothetical protein